MASPTLQPRVPLAPLTTLGVGGPCDQMAEVQSSDLPSVLEQAREQEQAVLLLGGGSNLLVADAGFRGLVMRLGDKTRSVSAFEDRVQVRVGAGVVWDDLVAWATEQGLGGLECLSGIPGLVGAAPMQNIGAYGQEVGESLVSVDAVDIQTGEGRRFSTAECELGYRTSRFKHRERGQWAVTSVTLALARGGTPALRYAELARRAAKDLGPSPSVQGVRELVLSIRASKSMVLDPADANTASAGSFFTNPVVSGPIADTVRELAHSLGIEGLVPSWPAESGVKLAAGWLIERAGFARGWGIGAAGLSARHTLAIINRGGATAKDVLRVAATVRRGVRDTFGVSLVPEPVFVGFEAGPDPSHVLDAAEHELEH